MPTATHIPLPALGSAQFVRQSLDLTTKEWARILGVATMTAQRWEHGTPPSGLASEVLRGITAALEAGVPAPEIRERLNLGVGAFLALALTTKTGTRP